MAEINQSKDKILMILRDNSLFPKVVRYIQPIKGATIVYSMWEGYLTDKFRDYCKDKGIEIKQIHTSGHAILKDLKAFAGALKPKKLIPVHTFEPEQYPSLFKNVRVLNDREAFELG